MSKIIGIVPKGTEVDLSVSNMNDSYLIGNNYVKRVLEAGCIPVGLAPVDQWLPEEELDLCDGFVVQGGKHFFPYHFQVIHHAVTKGKRYLGICMGAQLIHAYFELKKQVEARGYEGDLVRAMCAYLDAQGPEFVLEVKAPGHRATSMPRGEEDTAKHDVDVLPGTLLRRVLGRDRMRIASFHSWAIPPDQDLATVNAWSAKGDGVVEGVEIGDHILGVQGHPEVDGLLPELFQFLAQE